MDADGFSTLSTRELEVLNAALAAKEKVDLAARRKAKQRDDTWKARNLVHGGNRKQRRAQRTQTRLNMKHQFRDWQHARKVEAASNLRKGVS